MGKSLGHYEILEPLGAGGMGEVYRARDTQLNRDVAIKVVPPELAEDAKVLARFEREARMLAAVNHPHIATIHSVERSDGRGFIVMELLEGETLKERLRREPLQVDKALEIARQVAEALEAAHEKGIIHRDLKPANVLLTPDQRVKVLDFGLAKDVGPRDRQLATDSESGLTETGAMLGTAPYMSPEQVRGQAADARADIWGFGCLLYELLTGQPPFRRETTPDTMAAILGQEPDWGRLPASTPAMVYSVLRRCLRKDPDQRLHDIADARIEIEEALEEDRASLPHAIETYRAAPASRRMLVPLLLLVAGVLIGALGVRYFTSAGPSAIDSSGHFLIHLPPGQHLWGGHGFENNNLHLQRPTRTAVALSPDGRHLVYSATGEDGSRLYLRPLDDPQAVPLRGTERSCCPFFSPDGLWVGFFAHDPRDPAASGPRVLRKVPLDGGEPRTIPINTTVEPGAEYPRGPWGASWGASWGDDQTIVLSDGRGLVRVPDAGGSPQRLTTVDRDRGETGHIHPAVLPGSGAVLFTVRKDAWNWEAAEIAVQSIAGGDKVVLIADGADPRFVPPGYLVFARRGTLMAMRFDPVSHEVTGDPLRVGEDVMQSSYTTHIQTDTGAAQFSLSNTGSLVYAPGGVHPEPAESLVWVSRQGETEPLDMPARQYWGPRISPDGRYVAVNAGPTGQGDIWIYDLESNSEARLTVDRSGYEFPVWSSDSRRVAFTSLGAGAQLLWKEIGSSREPQSLAAFEPLLTLSDWSSRDVLALTEFAVENDIWVLPLEGEGAGDAKKLFEARFGQEWPTFSPDGAWVAYGSWETGTAEIYVRPYPGPDPVTKVSPEGGRSPAWSSDGTELFYRSGDKMMAVDVQTAGGFSHGRPRQLFQAAFQDSAPVRTYDVGSDGKFLMVTSREREPHTRIHVVLNWLEELRRSMPSEQ